LASNELALDATIGRSGYWQAMSWRYTQLQGGAGFWQAMSWRWTQYREERVLASNALALDATGYKCDLARVRA